MFAKITLFSPLRKLFDYKIPDTIINQAIVGVRAKIPFGNKILIGFIVDITTHSEFAEEKLKSIIEILDVEPILSKSLYQTLLWAANYYQSSIGALLNCALPKYIKENKAPKNNTIKLKPTLNKAINTPKTIFLNTEQQATIKNILLHSNKFTVNLLEGVTGSGKTEVYLQLTKFILEQNKQILILVPEIGLTPQTCQQFTERFTNTPIAILHSQLTAKQRYINWLNAKNGHAKIILGTRSAAFVSLLNPGLFIIDEEHDLSFKQQDSVHYMARDLLIIRAKFANCPIVLGSATPSLETLHNANLYKYQHYKLPNRVNTKLPTIELIDIRHKRLSSGLANKTISEIKQYLAQKNQVLLFINRRGFAPVLKCFNCQFTKKCLHCDANMNFHIYTNKLHCHHCQATDTVPPICPKCQQAKLIPIGQGTERIEQLFQELFPNVNIARIDQDSTTKKEQFNKILTDILEQKVDLLIGTQMIAKGHHFPNLSLVVIVDSDHALFSNDFRSTEHLGQLILQVAGRAGRENPGKVLLQTYYPQNTLIQNLASHNYQNLASLLLQERKISGLPPFSHQILWRVDSKTIELGIKFLTKIKQWALKFNNTPNNNCKIFGPIPAVMEKRKNKFHARLLFQHTNRNILQALNKYILDLLDNSKIPSSISWSVDVDPKETF
ncbi:MAG: primosomal protein N' [Gammaproteobacteria bacterium]|jgi:primosomal protein N' (replication factor Y)